MDAVSPSRVWWLLPHVLNCTLRTSTAVLGTSFLALACRMRHAHNQSALNQRRVCTDLTDACTVARLCSVQRGALLIRVLVANESLAMGIPLIPVPVERWSCAFFYMRSGTILSALHMRRHQLWHHAGVCRQAWRRRGAASRACQRVSRSCSQPARTTRRPRPRSRRRCAPAHLSSCMVSVRGLPVHAMDGVIATFQQHTVLAAFVAMTRSCYKLTCEQLFVRSDALHFRLL